MILDDAELTKIDEFTRTFTAMPISHQVSFWRPGILNRCLRARVLIKQNAPSRDGVSPYHLLKWQQSRLAEMRAWRATGVRPQPLPGPLYFVN